MLETTKRHVFCSFSNVFCWFQAWNHWKRFEMNKKGWKRLKKSSLTSFRVHVAPKSWSKYTTVFVSGQTPIRQPYYALTLCSVPNRKALSFNLVVISLVFIVQIKRQKYFLIKLPRSQVSLGNIFLGGGGDFDSFDENVYKNGLKTLKIKLLSLIKHLSVDRSTVAQMAAR